jgi:hypothetical protein
MVSYLFNLEPVCFYFFSNTGIQSDSLVLAEKILATNPILEAFGKTCDFLIVIALSSYLQEMRRLCEITILLDLENSSKYHLSPRKLLARRSIITCLRKHASYSR